MENMDYDSFISMVKYESSKLCKLDSIKDNKLPKGKISYLDYLLEKMYEITHVPKARIGGNDNNIEIK